jgi:hypothetical protein
LTTTYNPLYFLEWLDYSTNFLTCQYYFVSYNVELLLLLRHVTASRRRSSLSIRQ